MWKCFLEGMYEEKKFLIAERTISNDLTISKFHPETKELIEGPTTINLSRKTESRKYLLKPVEKETIKEMRRNGTPFFVLKLEGKLYGSKVLENISFVSSKGMKMRHMCALNDRVCARLKALPDEEGGCEKVRKTSCIEDYDWIPTGYESFNTEHDAFVVSTCMHHMLEKPKKVVKESLKSMTPAQIKQYEKDKREVEEIFRQRGITDYEATSRSDPYGFRYGNKKKKKRGNYW